MKLSENEKKVISMLIDNSRVSDTIIAKKLNLSVAAVGKIRKKLEREEVIEGYSCELNFEKLGITCFALISFKVTPKWLERYSAKETEELAKKNKRTIFLGRIYSGDSFTIALLGFKDNYELEDFMHQTPEIRDLSELKIIHTFTNKSLLKFTKKDLYSMAINEEKIKNPKEKIEELIEKK